MIVGSSKSNAAHTTQSLLFLNSVFFIQITVHYEDLYNKFLLFVVRPLIGTIQGRDGDKYNIAAV